MNDTDVPCYIARCKCGCGSLIFASVDEPEQSQERRDDTAKEIADLVRKGYTVERMTVGEVRNANWTCTRHQPPQAQMSLLEKYIATLGTVEPTPHTSSEVSK